MLSEYGIDSSESIDIQQNRREQDTQMLSEYAIDSSDMIDSRYNTEITDIQQK